jgi:glutamate-1-semialdehyde 2,1-aminomutase
MATADTTGIDRERAQALSQAENARFVAERPRSMALQEQARRWMPRGVPMAWMDDLYDHPPVWVSHGEGAHFTDVDGHTYLDLYVADMSAFCGHAPAPVAEAVARRMKLGNQFLLPGEDAIAVAEHLADRYGLAKWQFTSSATQANTEVIRLAREMTGRQTVLLFDGKYHGEGDATLVVAQDGEVVAESRGLPPWITTQARVVPFNDVEAVQAALAPGDVALVLAEPAMTNVGFLLPQPGFHDALRRLTREAGTLLAIDETHSLVCSYAGLAREWQLEPDYLVVGKSIAAGVPLAAYGMGDEIAVLIAPPEEARVVSGAVVDEVATGGTLFGNALSMAAGRAALLEVLTPEAFERTAALGARMAAGLRKATERAGLPWSVVQHGAHAFYFFVSEPPIDGAASRAADDPGLRALIRVFMANRGVWESGWWLGPTLSLAHGPDDVDRYVATFDDFLTEVT